MILRRKTEFTPTRRHRHIGVAVFMVSLVVYVLTTAPSVYTYDSAEFTLGVYTQGIVHSTGYPLYLIAARLFAFLPLHPDFAVRVNLFSGLMGAVTVYLLYQVNRYVVVGYVPLLAGGVALWFAFVPEIWSQAVIAEVYTLHTALVALMLLLTFVFLDVRLDGWLYLLGVIAGFALAHHLAAALILIILYPFWLFHASNWAVRVGMLCFTGSVTLAFYLYLPVRFVMSPEFNLVAAYFQRDLSQPLDMLWFMSGGMFTDRVFNYSVGAYAVEVGRFFWHLFTSYYGVGVVIGGVGIFDLWRRYRVMAVLLLLVFAGQVIFFCGYDVFDKWSMFHTAYLVWAIFVAVGAGKLFTYTHYVQVVLGVLVVLQLLTHWQTAGHFRDYAVRDRTFDLMNTLPPNAMLIGNWITLRPVEYYQIVEKRRQDIYLLDYSSIGLGLLDAESDTDAAFEQLEVYIDREIKTYPFSVYASDPPSFMNEKYPMKRLLPVLFRVR